MEAKMRRPRAEGLDRPRLSAPLCATSGPGVVVVLAPPGSGKTTLLALAVAGMPRAAWCTAGPEDRSGRGFLDHVGSSLSEVVGRDLGQPVTGMGLVEAVEASGGEDLFLVIDDVHELTGAPAEGQLEELLRWRPSRLRIALGSRRPLTLNTPRLLVSGELVQLEADDLRFRSWEVEELFRSVYHQPLAPEAAAALTRSTGGWAAGLKLFQLATSGKSRSEQERAVAELGGRSRLLRSYLTRTVLDELDASTRAFLLMTSTLGTLTGPLCDELMSTSGSARVLADLAARQFFTTASEDGASYRYHQVMQTLLEGLLIDEHGPARTAGIYARSGCLLERAGLVTDAARAYALAEDRASVARLVQQSDGSLGLGHLGVVTGPSDDPWLLLARARHLYRCGSVQEAVATYRTVEALVDDPDLHRRCAEERARAAVWLPEGAGSRSGPTSPAGASLDELVRQSTEHLDRALTPARSGLAGALRMLLAGDLADAGAALAGVPRTTPGQALVADLASVLVEASAEGESGALMSRLEGVVLAADAESQPWLARIARGVQATVLLILGEDEWRVDSFGAMVEECRRDGDAWGAILLAGLLGTALTVRDDERGQAWLQQAATAATLVGAAVLRSWAELLASLAAQRHGQPDADALLARAREDAHRCGLYRAEPVISQVLSLDASRPLLQGKGKAHRVRLRCLGSFVIEVDDNPAPMDDMRPLPRALLQILTMHHARDVHREVLMNWLWPDVPVDVATHRLHAAASNVRRALAGAALPSAELQRRGSSYRLFIRGAELDVADFDAARSRASRAEAEGDLGSALAWSRTALELYTGDLLPEAGPEEWVVEERERLRVSAAAAAYGVGCMALRGGATHEALSAVHRAIELDPLRDSAWQLLAEVQVAMGDVSAATATLRAHRELAREMSTTVDNLHPVV